MSVHTRRRWVYIVPTVLLLVTLASAFRWKDESDYFFRVNRGLEIFGNVYREVAQNYVDEVEPDDFIAAGIDGMLATLDPYTVYMDKREAAEIDVLTSGTYPGVGITVGMRDSVVTIVDVIDGYSARRQGIRIGDRIIEVNGFNVLRGPVDALRDRMRGDASTPLTLTVLREGIESPLTFTLTRELIRVRSVGYSALLTDDIGYIRLERFGSTAGSEIRDAITDMRSRSRLRGLILDLRDNPGGLLESAVDVVSKFVPVGSVVVSTRGRDPQEDRVYRSTEEPMLRGTPLVVLINENSASASEIVAGAVQDLDAGVIIGERSFGKGLVQSVRRLPYDASLKITTARYFTPSGRSIQKIDYSARRNGRESDTAHRFFLTAHGRSVEDHGGIEPDTVVMGGTLPEALRWLRDDSFLFAFGTRVAADMTELPAGFLVSDETLDRFEEFTVRRLDSTGGGRALASARDLERSVSSEGYDFDAVARARALRSELIAERRRLLRRYRDQVRTELEWEIGARFRSPKERAAAVTRADRQIVTAVVLLRGGEGPDYGRLLSTR